MQKLSYSLLAALTVAFTLSAPASAQRVRDGLISYPGGYTIEKGEFGILPPALDHATEMQIVHTDHDLASEPFEVGGTNQVLLDLTSGAGGFAAAWSDRRDGNIGIFVGFLDPTGQTPLDGAPIHLPRASRQTAPTIALLNVPGRTEVNGAVIWTANDYNGRMAKLRQFQSPASAPDPALERASADYMLSTPRRITTLERAGQAKLAINAEMGVAAWVSGGNIHAVPMQRFPNTGLYNPLKTRVLAGKVAPHKDLIQLAMDENGDLLIAWTEELRGQPVARLLATNLKQRKAVKPIVFGPGQVLDLVNDPSGGFWLLLKDPGGTRLEHVEADGTVTPDSKLIGVTRADSVSASIAVWDQGQGIAVLIEELLAPTPKEASRLRRSRNGAVQLHVFRSNGERLTKAAGIDALDQGAVDANGPQLAALGKTFIVAWSDSRQDTSDVFFRTIQLDQDNAPAKRWNQDQGAADQVHAALASNGKQALIAWEDLRFDPTQILTRTVSLGPDQKPEYGLEHLLNNAPSEAQAYPNIAVAANGSALVTWKQKLGRDWVMRGQRVQPNGSAMGKAFDLDKGHQVAHQFAASSLALPNDGGFMVAWVRKDLGVVSARFNMRGEIATPIQTLGVAPTKKAQRSSMALGDNGTILVVWDQPGKAKQSVVTGRLLDSEGHPLGGPLNLPPSPLAGDIDPSVAPMFGGGFMLTWTGNDGPIRDIFARPLDSRGAPSGAPVAISVKANEQDYAEVLRLEDGRFAIGWEDDISGRDHCFLRVLEVSQNGSAIQIIQGERKLIDATETVFVEDAHAPLMARLGSGALIVWDEIRRGKGHDVAMRFVRFD